MPRINRHISTLYRYGQRFISQTLRERGLPVEAGQITFLMRVYHQPGITQEAIAASLGMDKGTTARGVRQLEESGLVERRTDEKDRRVNHVFPSEKALALREDIRRILRELHEVLYDGLTEEEITQAVALLRRMEANIAARVDRPTAVPSDE